MEQGKGTPTLNKTGALAQNPEVTRNSARAPPFHTLIQKPKCQQRALAGLDHPTVSVQCGFLAPVLWVES